MKQMYYIGVDVSKGKVDIAVLNSAKEVVLEQIIKNEVKALNRFFRVLIRKLKIENEDILVCCETTGIYNHPLEVSCAQLNIFLWVESAFKIKKAASDLEGKVTERMPVELLNMLFDMKIESIVSSRRMM